MSAVDTIKDQLSYLPEKDEQLCMSFIEKRDFDSILEITQSDIIKLERKIRRMNETDPEIFNEAEKLDRLEDLRVNLVDYINQLTYISENDKEF